MDKAQQAAEERYPLNGDATNIAIRATLQTGYVAGRLDALPEVPDDAVIEAMAKAFPAAYQRAVQNASKGPDGISREQAHRCYVQAMTAAYAAMRGAMQ